MSQFFSNAIPSVWRAYQIFELIGRLSFPCKVSLNFGDIIHTGFLAFHTILDTSSHRLRSFPLYVAFPRSQYYGRSASLGSPQPQAGPAPLVKGPTSAVPRFRVMLSAFDLRLPLYTRAIRSVSTMNLRGLHPCSQRHSVTKSTFPWIIKPGTVHLSPSLSVIRLVRFRMRQSRVSVVAIAKLRLAVSGQDRVCPYPRVPRASDCLGLIVHGLSGQPHPRGDVDG